jgi:hypothetical protein
MGNVSNGSAIAVGGKIPTDRDASEDNRAMARPIRDRLVWDLTSIRNELKSVVAPIDNLEYVPREGMKNYRAILVEIGAMEAESSTYLRTLRIPDWAEAESAVHGQTASEVMASLDEIRQTTLSYLRDVDDARFLQTLPIPVEWESHFGTREVEPEEFLRWIVRHEYYHLGQIISYRWIEGNDPYQQKEPA